MNEDLNLSDSWLQPKLDFNEIKLGIKWETLIHEL